MDLHLNGKCALITGSSRGLGYATALGLAFEGAQVAVNGRDTTKLNSAVRKIIDLTGNSNIFPIPGDVSDPETPEKLVFQSVDNMGGLDILVTNAGGPPAGKFNQFDDNTWQAAIELSFMSHVRLIRASLPYLLISSSASVLTITSYSVKQPIPNLILSTSVRAATVGLTKSLALELGNQGIRFNSILPAWTETERVYNLLQIRANQNNSTIEEEIIKQAKDSALGRMGTLEEFANAAVFLVSPAASYITGVMLTVDGGMYKGTI
jgi:3-oxoacyl-[acyl-carrier protein] reductase